VKKLLKILAIIAVVIGMSLSLVFYLTADLTEVTEDFFLAVKNGDMIAASSYLTEDFVAATPPDELQEYMRKNALDDYAGASWASRSINSGTGSLSGTISTDSGGTIALTVGLLKTEGGWKIQSIRKKIAGAGVTGSTHSIPNEDELLALVGDSMAIFGRSVQAPDMTEFYDHLSMLWKNQSSQEDIEKIFGGHFQEADFAGLLSNPPTFVSAPTFNENGWLVIEGFYPTPPYRFNFTHKYTKEGFSWKLVGFTTWVDSIEKETIESSP
jgi:hypothetical protein